MPFGEGLNNKRIGLTGKIIVLYRLIMQKKAPYTGQLVRWLSGLVAAWLLLSLSVQIVDLKPALVWQNYISGIAPWMETDDLDYSSTDFIHSRVALVNSISGFSFGPSVDFLPGSRWIFHQIRRTEPSGERYQSHFAFRFLRLIFEHQIAINAP